MSFTRQELFEYFSDRYEAPVVESALNELSKFDTTVNPSGTEFSDHITEQMESVFETVDKTLEKQKSLPKVRDCATLVAESLKSEHGIAIPVESLVYIVQAAIVNARTSARIVNEAAQIAFSQELSSGAVGLTKNLLTAIAGNTSEIEQAFSGGNTQKIVDASCQIVETFDPKAFLAEVSDTKVATQFDLNKFLEEINA